MIEKRTKLLRTTKVNNFLLFIFVVIKSFQCL